MSKSIIILGGKQIDKDITELLYKHDYVCRINASLKDRLDPNKDIYFVNNHVKRYIFDRNIKVEELMKWPYNFLNKDVLTNIWNIARNKEYKFVIEQYESGRNNISNNILKELNCPYEFIKAPRCGYQAILHFLKIGYSVSVIGFSRENINEGTSYHNKKGSSHHDRKSEFKVLNWLIEKDIIKFIE